jgi:DNA-binding NtrC family response regulator
MAMQAHILIAVREAERDTIYSILQRKMYQAIVTSSIKSALSALESKVYRLALIDEDFVSAGEGWTLAKLIRQRFGPNLVMLMLVRGSYRDYFDSEEFLSKVDWIMHYPISEEEILGNVERYLQTN